MRNFCFEHANAVCCCQLDGAPYVCYYLLLAANENAARRAILYRQRKNKKPGTNGRKPCMNRNVKKYLHAFGRRSFWNACVMPHFTKRLFALRVPAPPHITERIAQLPRTLAFSRQRLFRTVKRRSTRPLLFASPSKTECFYAEYLGTRCIGTRCIGFQGILSIA